MKNPLKNEVGVFYAEENMFGIIQGIKRLCFSISVTTLVIIHLFIRKNGGGGKSCWKDQVNICIRGKVEFMTKGNRGAMIENASKCHTGTSKC